MGSPLTSARSFAARVGRRLRWEMRKREVSRRLRDDSVPPAGKPAILFFGPEAGVSPHVAAEIVLARCLAELGERVLIARCRALFERCPVMDMVQLPYAASARERAAICLRCADSSFELADAYGIEPLNLHAYASPEIEARLAEAFAAPPADLRTFTFDGIAFGKLAAHSLVLATKISDFETVTPFHRDAWLQYLRSAVRSYLLADRALATVSVGAVVHYDDYSLLTGAELAARKRGIPVRSMTLSPHRNGDRRRFGVLSVPQAVAFGRKTEAWPAWRELALGASLVREVADDLVLRFAALAAHTYSPARAAERTDFRGDLGLPASRKLVVAYTSSLDEMLATRMNLEALGFPPGTHPQPFTDQIDWLEQTVSYVEASEDLYLVVRIHPRESANKRDSVTSQHLSRLKAAFEGRSLRNCRIVWPQETISSYDLGEAADAVLFTWSSIGLEMSRMGVPTLSATNWIAPLPHDDFLEWADTPAAFFARLREILSRPASLDRIARAFRWYHLQYMGGTLDLSDLVTDPGQVGLPAWKLPRMASAIRALVVDGADVIEMNRARLAGEQDAMRAAEEKAALRTQLRRIVHVMHAGVEPPAEAALAGGTLEVNGATTTWRLGGEVWQRQSPLCARLAPMVTA